MQQTIILCPVYKDEASFNIFAAAVEKEVNKIRHHKFSYLVINDGTDELQLTTTLPLTLIHLHRNMGHQKAIAIGLSYAHHHLEFDQIIIMDCDGEDKPSDIIELIGKKELTKTIIVAERISRQESIVFQFFYRIYKKLFFMLVHSQISFGNFMLIPRKEVSRLVHHSEIWNHLAAALIKSNLNYSSIRSHRGKRYEGKSKMNFTALLLHGLGAIGVFTEVIASRLFIFSLSVFLISIIAIGIIFIIKTFTTGIIPEWVTGAVFLSFIVLLQSLLLSLFTIFWYLSFQGQRKFIPAHHYADYIFSVENKFDQPSLKPVLGRP